MAEGKVNDGRWAPWWVYVVLIVGANLIKQYFIGGKVSDVVNVAITVAMVGALIFVITAVYRSMFATRRR
ncbi:hypothetical protein ACFXGA_13190 [Actinosynnema sp. NPDC059335]|uniref:hypothetical protein n=1 Tax=Actinosynnema sp. NPDC059335 TaxID=3346804 RepID=UPI00366F27E9